MRKRERESEKKRKREKESVCDGRIVKILVKFTFVYSLKFFVFVVTLGDVFDQTEIIKN